MSKILKFYSYYKDAWLNIIPLSKNNELLDLETLDFKNPPKFIYGKVCLDHSHQSIMFKTVRWDNIKIVDLPEKQN